MRVIPFSESRASFLFLSVRSCSICSCAVGSWRQPAGTARIERAIRPGERARPGRIFPLSRVRAPIVHDLRFTFDGKNKKIGRFRKSPIFRRTKKNRVLSQRGAPLYERYPMFSPPSSILFFARAKATGANVNRLMCSVNNGLDSADVRLPRSVGFAVGVGYVVPEGNALSANTALCHFYTSCDAPLLRRFLIQLIESQIDRVYCNISFPKKQEVFQNFFTLPERSEKRAVRFARKAGKEGPDALFAQGASRGRTAFLRSDRTLRGDFA